MNRAEALKYRAAIERGVQFLDDGTALTVKGLFPAWKADTAYTVGCKVTYNDRLWRCVQAHASQYGWEPEFVPAMWESINETHSGTEDDPIPYEGNMALTNGLYYVQDYVVYRCIRDTGAPIYHALAEMVGMYVEVI